MGNYFSIQYEVMSKKMPPTFTLPEDKLLNPNQLKSKVKPLGDYLKSSSSSKPYERKDLDPKWDAVF